MAALLRARRASAGGFPLHAPQDDHGVTRRSLLSGSPNHGTGFPPSGTPAPAKSLPSVTHRPGPLPSSPTYPPHRSPAGRRRRSRGARSGQPADAHGRSREGDGVTRRRVLVGRPSAGPDSRLGHSPRHQEPAVRDASARPPTAFPPSSAGPPQGETAARLATPTAGPGRRRRHAAQRFGPVAGTQGRIPAVGHSGAARKPAVRDAWRTGLLPAHAEDPRPEWTGVFWWLGKGELRACRTLPWMPCRCCHPGTRRCRRRLRSGHRLRRTLRGRTGRRSRCPCRCGAG